MQATTQQQQQHEQQQQQLDLRHCLVPVRVYVKGKGVAEPGARLLCDMPQALHTLTDRASHMSTDNKRGNTTQAHVQIVASHQQGSQLLDVEASDGALRPDTAASAPPQLASAVHNQQTGATTALPPVLDVNEIDLPSDTEAPGQAHSNSNGVQSVVGIVTSGVARGVSNNTGAFGFCSLAALQQAQLQQRQEGSQRLDVETESSNGTALQMHCPQSKTVRDVIVKLLHGSAC